MSRNESYNQRGIAAIIMMVMMLLVDLIIIGVVLGGARDHELTARRLDSVQAFYAAEAGMNMAVREVVRYSDEDGDGTAGSISDDGQDWNNPALSAAQVFVEADVKTSHIRMKSTGNKGHAKRKIQAVLERAKAEHEKSLLINGDFERDVPGGPLHTGWNRASAAKIELVTHPVKSGTVAAAMWVDGEDDQQRLQQLVKGLKEDQLYTLLLDLNIPEISTTEWMNVGFQIRICSAIQGEVLVQHVQNTQTTGWTKISIQARASATGKLWIICYPFGVTSGTIYIDNIWFNVSELTPSS